MVLVQKFGNVSSRGFYEYLRICNVILVIFDFANVRTLKIFYLNELFPIGALKFTNLTQNLLEKGLQCSVNG